MASIGLFSIRAWTAVMISISWAVPLASTDGLKYVSCLGEGFCYDNRTEERFNCVEAKPIALECCLDASGQLNLYKSSRGSSCCTGHGMFDIQTHRCDNEGHVLRRDETDFCPHSFRVLYNTKNQICCPGSSGEPVVHLSQDGYECCGQSYINNATYGCCAGKSYDRQRECCKDDVVAAKDDCVMAKRAKSREKGCSRWEMEKRFKRQRRQASFIYVFQVRRQKKTDTTVNSTYVVKQAKQFAGEGDKLKAKKSRMTSIVIPRHGCPGTLEPDVTYVAMSKTKAKTKTLILQGRKYIILPVESSDVFGKIFGL